MAQSLLTLPNIIQHQASWSRERLFHVCKNVALLLLWLPFAASHGETEWPPESLDKAYHHGLITSHGLNLQLKINNRIARRTTSPPPQTRSFDIIRKLEGLHYILDKLEGKQARLDLEKFHGSARNYDLVSRMILLKRRSHARFDIGTESEAGRPGSTQNQDLYKLLNKIESQILGLVNPIDPGDVLYLTTLTNLALTTRCRHQQVTETKLVMGKRPKDVYLKLYQYLRVLQQHTSLNLPAERAGRILPQDVFDLSLISLASTRQWTGRGDLDAGGYKSKTSKDLNRPTITPSHVFQQVLLNKDLLTLCIGQPPSKAL